MSKFTLEQAASVIQRNGGSISGRQIAFAKPGLKVLAAIDFLVNHHNYVWIRKDPDRNRKHHAGGSEE